MTRIEYIGGCRALPSGERLRCRVGGRAVSVDSSDAVELSEGISGWLFARFGGRARLICESEARVDSCRKEEADDLSDRRLDLPVRAVLVSEWSELPDESERDGESRERSEADRLGTGLLIESLRSDETLDTRLICAVPAICECTSLCNGEGCAACDVSGGTAVVASNAGVPGIDVGGFG